MSDLYSRPIWRDADPVYVRRCGRCGFYVPDGDLKEHWFFSGVYCVRCIQEVLYDDIRTVEEMK